MTPQRPQYFNRSHANGMVAVKEFSWEEVAAPDFENPARRAWRQAVAEVAAKAHEKLPECNGRVDSAVKIVLAGDVELLPDGTAQVGSQSNGTTAYHVVQGKCTCKDFAKAPHNFCKHRLSAAIARRAQELASGKLEAATNGPTNGVSQPVPPPAALPLATQADIDQCVQASVHDAPSTLKPTLPEAPASANCYVTLAGRRVQVTLRDSDEERLLERLAALLRRFPVEEDSAQTPPEGWCRTHGVQMKLHHGKDGRTWYSHKTADGWCKGR